MSGLAESVLPFHGQLYGHALYMTRNKADAEDLVQETMLEATARWSSFEKGTNVRAWLFTILVHAYVNLWRRRKVRRRDAEARAVDIMRGLYGDETGYETLEVGENALSDEVRRALEKLGPDIFEVLNRHVLQSQPCNEIAEDLKLPVGTVMTRCHRARKHLEKELRDFAATEYGIKRR